MEEKENAAVQKGSIESDQINEDAITNEVEFWYLIMETDTRP